VRSKGREWLGCCVVLCCPLNAVRSHQDIQLVQQITASPTRRNPPPPPARAPRAPTPHSLANAVVDRGDWGEGVQAQRQVKLAAAEVVHDRDVVAARGQVQRGGPAAVAVAAWRFAASVEGGRLSVGVAVCTE